MGVLVILSILSSMVLISLLVVMLQQHEVLVSLTNQNARLKTRAQASDYQYIDEDFRKVTVENLARLGNQLLEHLEGTVAKLLPGFEKKKTEFDACQAEKKTKEDELAAMQNKHAEIKDALKKEADAWKQEIDMLTARLSGHPEICGYVKKNTLAEKLCTREPDPNMKPTEKQVTK